MARWQRKHEAAMRLANDSGATRGERAAALAKADCIRAKHLPNESQSPRRKRPKSLWVVEHPKSDRQLRAERRAAKQRAHEERQARKERRAREKQRDYEERCNRVYGSKGAPEGKPSRAGSRAPRGRRASEGKGKAGSAEWGSENPGDYVGDY